MVLQKIALTWYYTSITFLFFSLTCPATPQQTLTCKKYWLFSRNTEKLLFPFGQPGLAGTSKTGGKTCFSLLELLKNATKRQGPDKFHSPSSRQILDYHEKYPHAPNPKNRDGKIHRPSNDQNSRIPVWGNLPTAFPGWWSRYKLRHIVDFYIMVDTSSLYPYQSSGLESLRSTAPSPLVYNPCETGA